MALNTSIAARILRVDHGGEQGAIRIYRAQIAAARFRCPELLPFLSETLAHEIDHRNRFRGLMQTRAAKPCRLMWIWSIGGAVLGSLTGLAGRTAILTCTEAVERTVHRHLADQFAWLSGRDNEMADTIREIQRQEDEHLSYAESQLGKPTMLARALDTVICKATEALIWLSTRGDSIRLAAQIRPA